VPAKKVNFGAKPNTQPANIDQWVQERTAEQKKNDLPDQPLEKMKRLTLDIPEPLHRAIKSKAVAQGRTMVDMLRELLEETYG
jgi:predicted DNA binding CopG/RHH family protein